MTRLAEVHARSPRNALAVAAATVVISRRRHPPELAPRPSASGFARVVRGIWPLWAGALVLAALNGLTLFFGLANPKPSDSRC